MTSPLERLFESQCLTLKLPVPVREWEFRVGRNWRADFAWPEYRLILEIEGGIHSRGRHTRAQGFANDVEKYNEAALGGWVVLRATGEMVRDGRAIGVVARFFDKSYKARP
ncbi:hypothetical protein SAMN02949497_1249 [Methylomagnum ishizawai]|uniref:DUF559 domain-containing protein n=1 Tax=Methylomagnum ishizawai TaxID=1760988 RepID=A0A1Y6CZF4_9GAMM|nr:hypothetical protein SAMN02949497_1249 [Methylomagnum ishizawai]